MHTSDYVAIGVVAALALIIQLFQYRVRRAMERGAGASDLDPSKPDARERVVVKDEED